MRRVVAVDPAFVRRARERRLREVNDTIRSLRERGFISIRGIRNGELTYRVHWDRVNAAGSPYLDLTHLLPGGKP